MTYLPAAVLECWFHLYLILDLNGSPIGPVTLNPERNAINQTHSGDSDKQPSAT